MALHAQLSYWARGMLGEHSNAKVDLGHSFEQVLHIFLALPTSCMLTNST